MSVVLHTWLCSFYAGKPGIEKSGRPFKTCAGDMDNAGCNRFCSESCTAVYVVETPQSGTAGLGYTQAVGTGE